MQHPKAIVPTAEGRGSDAFFWLLAPFLLVAAVLSWLTGVMLTLRPGYTVNVVDATPGSGLPTSTGVGFMVGFTADGAYGEAHRFTSFGQFKDATGARVAHGMAYDSAAAFFDHGGAVLYFSRVGGAGATVGDDNFETAVDADWQAALDAFPSTLGPGQVFAPGRTTTPAHLQLIAHAAANNRVALLDGPDTDAVATLTALGDAALGADAWRAILFAGWVDVIDVDLATATRALPPSPIVAGLIAKVDVTDGPGQPPAGEWGHTKALTLRNTFTDAQWDTLDDSHVNLLINDGTRVKVFGYDSVTADDDYRQFNGARIAMGLIAELGAETASFNFAKVDGRGRRLSAWGGRLTSVCDRYYGRDDLYGATPDEAFDVDTGPTQNPPEQLALGNATARVQFRPSPFAKNLTVDLERHRIDQPLSA